MTITHTNISFHKKGDNKNIKPLLEKRFYVYALSLTASMSQVFYIGKGQGARVTGHAGEADNGHICPKCAVIRYSFSAYRRYWWSIIAQTNDEGEAFWLEMRAITSLPYGRLCNMSGGPKFPVSVSQPQLEGRLWIGAITYSEPGSSLEKTDIFKAFDYDDTREQIVLAYDRYILQHYAVASGHLTLRRRFGRAS